MVHDGKGDEFEQKGITHLYESAAMKSVSLYATIKKKKKTYFVVVKNNEETGSYFVFSVCIFHVIGFSDGEMCWKSILDFT